MSDFRCTSFRGARPLSAVLACLGLWACAAPTGGETISARRDAPRKPAARPAATPRPIFVADNRPRPPEASEAPVPQQFEGLLSASQAATQALLKAPHRLLALPDGSVLISEVWASRVTRLTPAGRLEPFAGGAPYLARADKGAAALGDGGSALEAILNGPTALAADAAGTVYVCDWRGHRVRRIEAGTGLISTAAGARAAQGNLLAFTAVTPGAAITAGVAAAAAEITHPHAVAVDAQGRCVFACQEGTFRVESDGKLSVLQPPAGRGTPAKLASSPAGEVFCAYGDGTFAALQGDAFLPVPGAARAALTGTWQLAASGGGRLVLLAGNALHAFEGGAWRELTRLDGVENPVGLAVTAAAAWVSSEVAGQVWRCDPAAGTTALVAGLAVDLDQPLAGSQVQLSYPSALSFDRKGRLLVADGLSGVIWRRSEDDTYQRVAGRGAPPDQLGDVVSTRAIEAVIGLTTAITVGEQDAFFFSAGDYNKHRLRQVSAKGEIQEVPLPDGINPLQAVRDAEGAWIISDAVLTPVPSGRIVRLSPQGVVEELVPRKPLRVCYGLLPRGDGSLYFCDPLASLVYKRDPDGEVFVVAGNKDEAPGFAGDGGMGTYARLNWPLDLALDDKGRLYIADAANHRVRRMEAVGGKIETFAGEGGLQFAGTTPEEGLREPCAVLFDKGGNLLIADAGHNQIKRVSKARL